MPTLECHFCRRQIDMSEAMWFRPFAAAQRTSTNTLQTFASVSRDRSEGAVPCCSTCVDEMDAAPEPGHTLVIEKDQGRADVMIQNADGAWNLVREDISD